MLAALASLADLRTLFRTGCLDLLDLLLTNCPLPLVARIRSTRGSGRLLYRTFVLFVGATNCRLLRPTAYGRLVYIRVAHLSSNTRTRTYLSHSSLTYLGHANLHLARLPLAALLVLTCNSTRLPLDRTFLLTSCLLLFSASSVITWPPWLPRLPEPARPPRTRALLRYRRGRRLLVMVSFLVRRWMPRRVPSMVVCFLLRRRLPWCGVMMIRLLLRRGLPRRGRVMISFLCGRLLLRCGLVMIRFLCGLLLPGRLLLMMVSLLRRRLALVAVSPLRWRLLPRRTLLFRWRALLLPVTPTLASHRRRQFLQAVYIPRRNHVRLVDQCGPSAPPHLLHNHLPSPAGALARPAAAPRSAAPAAPAAARAPLARRAAAPSAAATATAAGAALASGWGDRGGRLVAAGRSEGGSVTSNRG